MRCRGTWARWTWCCRCCTATYGEDGTLQGLLEMTGTRYAGRRGVRQRGRHGQGVHEADHGRARAAGRAGTWWCGTATGARPGPSASGCSTRSPSSAGRCSSSRPAAGRASGSPGSCLPASWRRRSRPPGSTTPRCWSRRRSTGWRSSARCSRAWTAARPRRACPARCWWTIARRSTTSGQVPGGRRRRWRSRRRFPPRPLARSGGWPARRSTRSPARGWPGWTSSTRRPGRSWSTRSTRCRG